MFGRLLAIIFAQGNTMEVDDVCVGLTLMYGYVTSYAPSTIIETWIKTLVVGMFIPHIVFLLFFICSCYNGVYDHHFFKNSAIYSFKRKLSFLVLDV